MTAHYARVVRHCDWCDAERMVDVETNPLSSDSSVEMWRCLDCGTDHHCEFIEGEDN